MKQPKLTNDALLLHDPESLYWQKRHDDAIRRLIKLGDWVTKNQHLFMFNWSFPTVTLNQDSSREEE